MHIPNDDTQIFPSVDYNQWLKPKDTIKAPKVVKPINKKTLL